MATPPVLGKRSTGPNMCQPCPALRPGLRSAHARSRAYRRRADKRRRLFVHRSLEPRQHTQAPEEAMVPQKHSGCFTPLGCKESLQGSVPRMHTDTLRGSMASLLCVSSPTYAWMTNNVTVALRSQHQERAHQSVDSKSQTLVPRIG